MDEQKAIRETLRSSGRIDELCEVRTFVGYRNGHRVTVRVLDLGPNCSAPEQRYFVEAEQDDGKRATGNNAPTLEEAICIVHWQDLD